ncbi:MAG: helix-turn-helix domain-containing protein [Candidatus Aenigmatarchaeota archaeon]
MKPVCEVVVQDVLPAIRALVAKELMEKYKLTQTDVAERLGVTQAAVSQYTRHLRGYKIKAMVKDSGVMKEVENLAKAVAKENIGAVAAMQEVCAICRLIRNKKLLCAMHKSCAPQLEKCAICAEKC